jgi:hypothetical protein
MMITVMELVTFADSDNTIRLPRTWTHYWASNLVGGSDSLFSELFLNKIMTLCPKLWTDMFVFGSKRNAQCKKFPPSGRVVDKIGSGG